MIEILEWSQLATVAGVATAVTAITEVLKHYITNVDPKWIALLLSLVITYAYQIITGDLAVGSWILSAFNALLSTGVAIGIFESAGRPIEEKIHRRRV